MSSLRVSTKECIFRGEQASYHYYILNIPGSRTARGRIDNQPNTDRNNNS